MRVLAACVVALGLVASPAMAGTGAAGDKDGAAGLNAPAATANAANPTAVAAKATSAEKAEPASMATESELQQLRELAGSGRISTGVRPVLKAASEGRVAKLILAEEAEFAATREALESDSPEDLLNAAAVLSIRNGGEVFTLPVEAMGAEAPVAAILRY